MKKNMKPTNSIKSLVLEALSKSKMQIKDRILVLLELKRLMFMKLAIDLIVIVPFISLPTQPFSWSSFVNV